METGEDEAVEVDGEDEADEAVTEDLEAALVPVPVEAQHEAEVVLVVPLEVSMPLMKRPSPLLEHRVVSILRTE